MRTVWFLFLFMLPLAHAQCIVPETNQRIASDALFCPGTYDVENIGVFGNGFSIGCNGTRFRGSEQGTAIKVIGAANITIQGCKFSNYEVGVSIEDSQGITVMENRFLDNKIGIAWLRSSVIEKGNEFIGSIREDSMEIQGGNAKGQTDREGEEAKPTPRSILAQ